MAFTVQEALDIVQATTPLRGAESIATFAADQALAELWSQHAWRETLADFDPITLIPGVQDYPEPLANIPDDIGGLWSATYVHLAEDGTKSHEPLTVRRHLEPTENESLPKEIAYQQDKACYRLSARAGSNVGSPWDFVTGTYKKTAPRVTYANIAGLAFPFDDELASTYVSVLRWKFLELLGDQRAPDAAGTAIQLMNRKATMRGMRQGSDQVVSTINVNGF